MNNSIIIKKAVVIFWLSFIIQSRDATGVAHAPKPDKTPITLWRGSILQNPGNTAVLPVLPPMAPLQSSSKILAKWIPDYITEEQEEKNPFLLYLLNSIKNSFLCDQNIYNNVISTFEKLHTLLS